MSLFGLLRAQSDGNTDRFRTYAVKPLPVAMVLYTIVCAGAFGIEEMIPICGPGLTIVLLVAIPILWALPYSLLVSENASSMPYAAADYSWAKLTFGEFWGFQVGWWVTIANILACSAYMSLCMGYLSILFDLSMITALFVKLFLVAIVLTINLRGFGGVATFANVMSALIVIVFVLVIVLGFTHVQTNPIAPFIPEDQSLLESLGAGFSIVLWMFVGYESAAVFSEEYHDQTVVSKAIRIVLPLMALTYLLPTLASLACLPEGTWMLWSTDEGIDVATVGYQTVLTTYLGPAGGVIFLIIAIVSQFSMVNSTTMYVTRYHYTLSRDNLFFPSISRLDDEGRSPYVSLFIVQSLVFLISELSFVEIVEIAVFFELSCKVVMACVAVRQRQLNPIEKRKSIKQFYIKGGNGVVVVCASIIILFAYTCLVLCGSTFILGYIIVLAIGIVLYIICKRHFGGLAITDPQNNPTNKFGLAVGDGKRIAVCVCAAAFGILSCLFFGF